MSVAVTSVEARLGAHDLLPLSRRDKIAISLLIIAPLLIAIVPTLFGHVLVPGDDLNQNLPLRALSGEFYRAGKLPAWNPLIWTGTPLLSGWNAGSLFPGTFLFAFMPLALAWGINLALAPAVAAIGIYLLLRRFGAGEVAAAFAGAVFAYTGFMAGQVVHVGLIQGTAFTPWIILGLDFFFRPGRDEIESPSIRQAFTNPQMQLWVVVLAISIAATVLAGDPRAISSSAVAALIYLIALLIRPRAHRITGIGLTVLAGALGAALSAAQLLPGLAFLHASQRDTTAISFFATGSIQIHQLLTLFVLPFSLGANGNFGLPIYRGSYNLPELTFAAGFIALVASAAFIPETLIAFSRWIRRRPRAEHSDTAHQLGIWFAFVIVGVVLSLGTNLPTGRLLVHIPFFGNERLQNRNIALADFALAIFAGLFLDELLKAVREHRLKDHRLLRGITRVMSAIPLLVGVAAIIIEYVDPLGFQRYLGVPTPYAPLASKLNAYLIPVLIIIFLLGILLLFGRHLPARIAYGLIAVVAIGDVGIFVANASYASAPTSLYTAQTALSSQLRHELGGEGRFALFDPYYAITTSHPQIVDAVGLPDVNVLQENPSVQGYGSIVNGVYQRVTGSHLLNSFKAPILKGPSVNTIDLRIFLTPRNYLENPLSAHQAVPLPSNLQNLAPGIPHLTNGPWNLKPGVSTTWQLSQVRHLRRVTFEMNSTAVTKGPIAITIIDGAKVVERTVIQSARALTVVRLNSSLPASTIVMTNTSGSSLGVISATITTADPNQRFVLNGLLQGDLPYSHWIFNDTIGLLTSFKNTQIRGLAWLQPPTTHTPNTKITAKGRVVVTRGPVTSEQVMRVSAPHAVILARSEAYSSGWSVDVAPSAGGPSIHETVHRFGLIQEITLPAGQWIVTWHYRPTTLRIGLLVTLLALLIIIAWAAKLTYGRRRRSRGTTLSLGGTPPLSSRPLRRGFHLREPTAKL